jgi:amidase
LSKTCGGSSGGSAVALATGMAALADGTDMGGSLRCPANYCNVVGLRPSVGRVADFPAQNGWGSLSVNGPMARSVTDLALYLSVMAGYDARDPMSISEDGARFNAPLEADMRGKRIAFCPDFGGLPVDPEVLRVVQAQRRIFEDLGCIVDDACPDLRDAHEIFMTLRAYAFELQFGAIMDRHPGMLKDTVVWNIEAGRKLSASALARAEKLRTALFMRMHRFMESHDAIIAPVNQVPPFDIDKPYIDEIAGVKMENYIDWMRSCYLISATTHPAMSVPAGFTSDGLPVGIQIVGRHRGELDLLRIAYAFEQANGAGRIRPKIAA